MSRYHPYGHREQGPSRSSQGRGPERPPGIVMLDSNDPILDWSWDSLAKITRHLRGCSTCDDYLRHLQLAARDSGFERASLQHEINFQQIQQFALERVRQESEEQRVTIRTLTEELEQERKTLKETRTYLDEAEDELDDARHDLKVAHEELAEARETAERNATKERATGRPRSTSAAPRSPSPGARRKGRSPSTPIDHAAHDDVTMADDTKAAVNQEVPPLSLLHRMGITASHSAPASLLSRIASAEAPAARPALLMRLSDAPGVTPKGEGPAGKQAKSTMEDREMPNPEDYEPGLGFLRDNQTEATPINSQDQLRWPVTELEAKRLAAEAMRPGNKLALSYWGNFLRAANTGKAQGPAALTARMMLWTRPDWTTQRAPATNPESASNETTPVNAPTPPLGTSLIHQTSGIAAKFHR